MIMEQDYSKLRTAAGNFWDVQEFRKAMENRARSGRVDSGLVAEAAPLYRRIENLFSKVMVNEMRDSVPEPIQAWARDTPGIGTGGNPHLLAKLLGVIGDPYIATPRHWEQRPGAKGGKDDPKRVLVEDPPFTRNLGKLWAYCGVGDPRRRRRPGQSQQDAAACGTWKAKTTLRLMAESCVKAGKQDRTPYYLVYEQARAHYVGRVHDRECKPCKGSSKPGDPWRDGHQHAAALRKVAKEILRDLWEIAREVHTGIPRGHLPSGAHIGIAPGEAAA